MNEQVTVVGNDGISDIVAYTVDGHDPIYYRLTNCCKASGKGWESVTGVVCRSCFVTVSPEFGDAWTSAEDLERWTGLKVDELEAAAHIVLQPNKTFTEVDGKLTITERTS